MILAYPKSVDFAEASRTRLLAVLLLLAFASVLRAGPDEETDPHAIPVVGRPSDLPFSEASGWFEVRARAEPTTVEAETPTTCTVAVRATRPVRRSPQRIDLRQLPAFADSFYIEDLGEEPNRPDAQTWEFVYRLKPRRTEVRQIPSFPFVYFNPYLFNARKGFQVLFTDPIPLHVLPHETVQVPVQAAESVFVLATGPGVLERQAPWRPPGMLTSLILLVVPPLACVVWYAWWRRSYPDAARMARQRRSRAARHALQRLQAIGRLDAEQRAAQAAAIVAGYLQQRLDLAVTEPTPHEIALLCEDRHLSPALTEQAIHFFETCDSVRFLPAAGSSRPDLPECAVQLILAVEEETCPADLS